MCVRVSTILERGIELVGKVQKGLGGSRRVWNSLEVSQVGPGRIPIGSKDSGEFEKSRPSQHYWGGTRLGWLTCLNQKTILARYTN